MKSRANIVKSSSEPDKSNLWLHNGILKNFSSSGWKSITNVDEVGEDKDKVLVINKDELEIDNYGDEDYIHIVFKVPQDLIPRIEKASTIITTSEDYYEYVYYKCYASNTIVFIGGNSYYNNIELLEYNRSKSTLTERSVFYNEFDSKETFKLLKQKPNVLYVNISTNTDNVVVPTVKLYRTYDDGHEYLENAYLELTSPVLAYIANSEKTYPNITSTAWDKADVSYNGSGLLTLTTPFKLTEWLNQYYKDGTTQHTLYTITFQQSDLGGNKGKLTSGTYYVELNGVIGRVTSRTIDISPFIKE